MLKCLAPLALLVCLPLYTQIQDVAAQEAPAIAKFEGDASDTKALQKYAGEIFGDIAGLLQANKADDAAAKLDALAEFSKGLDDSDAKVKSMQTKIDGAIDFFRQRIELARVSIDDLKEDLEAEPTKKAIDQYMMKLGQTLAPLASSDPEKAKEQLEAEKEFINGIAESSEDDGVKRAIAQGKRMFSQLDRMIEDELKLAKLIGADAPPLGIAEWANGEPLSDDDLKGKVILLDFWAVWCGPCIATFPHLREWDEKYADKGLVIIGLTRYYNMKWDDEKGRATRSTDDVEPEEELEMLAKFAEEHKLTHRFGIQEDRKLADFFAVTGIPHVVLIDREGKIRLMKVGAGPGTAEEIDAMLEELIAG